MRIIDFRENEKELFKAEMQIAFQEGYESRFGETNGIILPFSHIERSLEGENAYAFEVLDGEERVGGAIVSLSEDGTHGDLDFLYTKVGCQNRGAAKMMWKYIEEQFPEVEVWETCTPYFDERNIHFYVNRCGFHIVEFFNSHHPEPPHPDTEEDTLFFSPDDPMYAQGMFRFEKRKSF